MQIEILTHQIVNISSAIDNIKGGRVERAIELLERGLDGCVFALGQIQKKGEIPDEIRRDTLKYALNIARVHRQRHPRQAKTVSGTTEPYFPEAVKKILEDIEG